MTDTDNLEPDEMPENIALTGEEQITLARIAADAETARMANENQFKISRTEARVKAIIASVAGAIVVAIVICQVVLQLEDKKTPEFFATIPTLLVGIMSGVALSGVAARASKQ
jgi:hypothetical protein